MTAPTVQEIADGKTDLDNLGALVNGVSTVSTRTGGDKPSYSQVIAGIQQGTITTFSGSTTYTDTDEWVLYNDVVYRPLPSALPISPASPEAFNAAEWVTVGGWTANDKIYPPVADYATLRNLEPDKLTAGTVIHVTDSGIAGAGTIVKSTSHGLSDNGGTIIVIDANTYWCRNFSGSVNVRWFGAAGDGVTDNTSVINSADEAAYAANCRVFFPYGVYRVTGPIQRKVEHYGEQIRPQEYSTIHVDNTTPFTLYSATGIGSNPQRSVDVTSMLYSSEQDRIHTFMEADMYRGQFKDVFIRGFDVGLDLAGVYIDFHNLRVSDCNIGLYPRKQLVSGTPSTMFSLRNSLFLGNTYGIKHEQRSGSPTSNDDLLGLSLENTGFEQNTNTGLYASQRVWYITTQNCWAESNGQGYQLLSSFTDWVDINSRWDDATNTSNARHIELLRGAVTADEFKAPMGGEIYAKPNTFKIIIESDGTIVANGNEGLVDTAVVSTDLTLTMTDIWTYPIFNVTPIRRQSGIKLVSATYFNNTDTAGDVESLGKVNQFVVSCYDVEDDTTKLLPYWYVIEIGE